MIVEYDPRLVEEVVLLRLRGDPREPRFRKQRDRLYETADPDEREQGFRHLHLEWWVELGLDQPLSAAVAEGLPGDRVARVIATMSHRRADEGVELYVPDPAKPVVVIALAPERFLDPVGLVALLRRELMHAADMLDPTFGYEPRLPPSPIGPAHDRLLRERYRALWNTTIDGRLGRARGPETGARARCLEEFRRLFPGCDEAFDGFFDGGPHTHATLLAFAAARGAAARDRCPLCGFPASGLERVEPGVAGLEPLRSDFPAWRPQEGLCRQCADRYHVRTRDRRAAEPLGRFPFFVGASPW